jgi:hypothetical protein
MAKTVLDVGVTVDLLNKDELSAELQKNQARASAMERERLKGIKYIRAPRIQGTVYNGTIGNPGGTTVPAGTLYATLGGPPWGPQQGYSWSIRRIACGGLANVNGTNPDTIGIYRNTNTAPLMAQLTANAPSVTFPTLGLVVHGGDNVIIGHVPNQVASNTYGTLTSTYIQADFDVIEVPTEMLGKLA